MKRDVGREIYFKLKQHIKLFNESRKHFNINFLLHRVKLVWGFFLSTVTTMPKNIFFDAVLYFYCFKRGTFVYLFYIDISFRGIGLKSLT